jgi:hypothetical protein
MSITDHALSDGLSQRNLIVLKASFGLDQNVEWTTESMCHVFISLL